MRLNPELAPRHVRWTFAVAGATIVFAIVWGLTSGLGMDGFQR